jgi:hypothetical protein
MGRIPGPVSNLAEYVPFSAGNPVHREVDKASDIERTHEKYAVG